MLLWFLQYSPNTNFLGFFFFLGFHCQTVVLSKQDKLFTSGKKWISNVIDMIIVNQFTYQFK